MPARGGTGATSRTWLGVDAAIKAATVGLLLLAVLAPELPQFQGKAFAGRAIAYPVALAVVPVAWWWLGRGRARFPVRTDILLGLPFLIDMTGNALNLYDTIEWWDDANHLGNWALHTAAIVLLARGRLASIGVVAVGIAWAATTAILWELAEYVAFVPNSPEAVTAYADTLGDLALGLIGGAAACVAIAWRAARSRAATNATGVLDRSVVPTGDAG
jgi:hypothetical protein